MTTLLLLGPAREAAGVARVELGGSTVAEVLAAAVERYGDALAAVVDRSRIWVNGEAATPGDPVTPYDEVAVIPPVSGG